MMHATLKTTHTDLGKSYSSCLTESQYSIGYFSYSLEQFGNLDGNQWNCPKMVLALCRGTELFCVHWVFWITSIGHDTWGFSRISSCTTFVQHIYAAIGSNHADNEQFYVAVSPDGYSTVEVLCHSLDRTNNSVNQESLQLKHNKTEIKVFGSKENRIAVRKRLESLSLNTKDQVWNLGVLTDLDLAFSIVTSNQSNKQYCTCWRIRPEREVSCPMQTGRTSSML